MESPGTNIRQPVTSSGVFGLLLTGLLISSASYGQGSSTTHLASPLLAAASTVTAATATATPQQVVDAQAKEQAVAIQAQQQINELDDKTREMVSEYRRLLEQTEELEIYNEQLVRLTRSQEKEIINFDGELTDLESTRRQLIPWMQHMISTLNEVIAADIPFLPKERNLRLQELKDVMERADVSVADKYRRILEAYQIESEYGHTIEAYQGEITLDGDVRTVDFLRFGRVGLYYLSLDGKRLGMWDKESRQMIVLGDNFREPLDKAIRVARKQMPPDLLKLPVQAPSRGSNDV